MKSWLWLFGVLWTLTAFAQENPPTELEQNLAILEKPVTDPRNWVSAAFNVGKFYQNNPQQAEVYFLKGLQVAQQYKLGEMEASIYNQLFVVFRNEPKGLKYLQQAIKLAEKRGETSAIMQLRLMLAGYYFRQQQPKKAIDLYEELLPEFRKTASRQDLVMALLNYGNAVMALGDYEKALELGEVVSTIAAKIPNAKFEQLGLVLQGKALQKQGQYEASLRVRNDALKKAESTFDIDIQANVLHEIASLFDELDDPARALPYLKSALELSKKSGTPERQFSLHGQLAWINMQLGDKKQAAVHVAELQVLEVSRKIKSKALSQNIRGRLLYENGEQGRGIDMMQRGLLGKGTINKWASENRLIVAEYFSEKGFYKKAEEHFAVLKTELAALPADYRDRYEQAWGAHQRRKKGQPVAKLDSLGTKEKSVRIKARLTATNPEKLRVLQLEDSLTQAEQAEQIALLNAENKLKAVELRKNEFRFYLFLLSLLVLLLISGFGLFWYRSRKRQAELLAQKEKKIRILELEEAEKRKKLELIDALLEGQEIERKRIAESLHDDVGSMLSALRLQLEQFETEDKPASEKAHLSLRNAKDMLDHVATDVRNLSHILMPSSLGKFGLKKAVTLYVEQLNQAGKVHFDLIITGFEQPLAENIELSTYRILLELCNNILKHAEARNVIIQLVEHSDQLVLMIEDNGKGFEPVDNSSDGIGLRTIESRLHLMQGKMTVESAAGQGTIISIELPLVASEE